MPKRPLKPFRFNYLGTTGHWGSKRGLHRMRMTPDPDQAGHFTITWPSRKHRSRNSGLCANCNRRTRARWNRKHSAWECRACGTIVTQLRSADDPGPMAIPTRLASYVSTTLPKRLTPQRRDLLVASLTPAQRRRLVHKAGGKLEQYRGPDRPLGRKAREELARAEAEAATMRSHP